jgi:HB1, ASXL, restriction endonuclease HTH domain
MSGKKKAPTTAATSLQTLKIGSRVRCSDDRVEGRITWASGTHVKIKWDDGEQVTWKRADLAGKGLVVLDPDQSPVEQATPEPAPVEQAQFTTTEQTPAEQTPPVEQVATKQAAVADPAPAKKPRTRKAPADLKEKKVSALDAAVKVLGEAGQPMTCQEMIDTMAAKGYWTSPGGQTPAATLYSAILRELANKGADARFVKTERGMFGLKS